MQLRREKSPALINCRDIRSWKLFNDVKSGVYIKIIYRKSGLWKIDMISWVTWKPGVRIVRFDCITQTLEIKQALIYESLNVTKIFSKKITSQKSKNIYCKWKVWKLFTVLHLRNYFSSTLLQSDKYPGPGIKPVSSPDEAILCLLN